MKKVIMLSFFIIFTALNSYGQSICNKFFSNIQSKKHLIELVQQKNPAQYLFTKKPIFAYKIISHRLEDIPKVIVKNLGQVDQTKYSSDYLRENIGSVFALQIDKGKPDFYVISKEAFEKQYKTILSHQITINNRQYLKKLSQHIPEILNLNDENLIAIYKFAPVSMIKMSDLGYPVEFKITIESPWGEQTKPAGADAFLVLDEFKKEFYMINTDSDGLPLTYISVK